MDEEIIGSQKQIGDRVIKQKTSRVKKDRTKKSARIKTRARRREDAGGSASVKLINKRRRRPAKKIQIPSQDGISEAQPTALQPASPPLITVSSQQLVVPNPNISCTPGWCLVYVRETFGIGPKYPSATANWNASQHKHTDQNFPANVWVPVWFSLSDNPHGHVALRQPDGSIWSSSSPSSEKPIQHTSLPDIISYYGNRLTYLGWTEDIEDVMIMSESSQAVAPVVANPAGPILAKAVSGPEN